MNIAEESVFEATEETIKTNPAFDKVNQDHGHGDHSAAMRLYKMFLSSFVARDMEETQEEDLQMTAKENLNYIKKYIAAKGFTYVDGLIENFYLSLKSKPFVILAGTSGTGKTRLVKLFAEAIGVFLQALSVFLFYTTQ